MLGASRWELAAFRTAVLQYLLRDEVDERTAVGVVWNGGAWRPMVEQHAEEHWHVAVRLTQQEAAGARSARWRRRASRAACWRAFTAPSERPSTAATSALDRPPANLRVTT